MPILSGEVSIPSPSTDSRHTELYTRIAAREESAEAELYALIGRTIRATVYRDFRGHTADAEDIHHEVFIELLSAIRAAKIRNPGSLLSFARTMIQRKKAHWIGRQIRGRDVIQLDAEPIYSTESMEEILAYRNQLSVLSDAMEGLRPHHKEILDRFYLEGESQVSVMASMGLNECQYRNLKSKALHRLGQHVETGRRRKRLGAIIAC